MNKKKIYHIHTDFKFLYDSSRFDDERFENILVIIDEKNERNKAYHEDAIFFQPHEDSVPNIVKLISDADLIVIYNLCEIKKLIVKNLPKEIKIAWRFFGHELYGKRRDLVLSNSTLRIVENANSTIQKGVLKLKFLKRRINYLIHDHKIVQRIDFILLFFAEEYDFLKKYWKVPEYVKLNLNYKLEEKEFEIIQKKNKIIVGNSRNIYNNHLDILNIIVANGNESNSFNLFFNYGSSGEYEKQVRNFSARHKIHLIEEFLSKKDFEKIYEESIALVINSYRQMALGNIMTAIKYGLKIYLNDKNPTKSWLIRNGIKVYTIQEFETDLSMNNLSLSIEEKYENIKNFNKLVDDFSRDEFCTSILNKIAVGNEK